MTAIYPINPLTISGGTVSGNVTNSSQGTVNINGGTITGNVSNNSSGEVNISKDSTINGFIANKSSGSVKINNIDLKEVTDMPTANINGKDENFTDEDNKNNYIAENCVAIIGTKGDDNAKYFTTLEAAFSAANASDSGATITLLKNTTIDSSITVSKNITLELGNNYPA